MLKYLLISGSHPRHIYYANAIIGYCNVVGVVVEKRENLIPELCGDHEEIDRANFKKHFENRAKCEKKYFGDVLRINHENVLEVDSGKISTEETKSFIEKLNPDVVFIFGPGMIKEPLFSSLPKLKINMHLGLSPRYRGSATLFWPFYFLEPQWAGSTFHIISEEPDAGDIIHQTVPTLERGDTIHDVGCKVVARSALEVKEIIDLLDSGKTLRLHKQKSTGKKFLSKDFSVEHLRLIYNLFDDKIVDYYLNLKKKKKPKLIKVECENEIL